VYAGSVYCAAFPVGTSVSSATIVLTTGAKSYYLAGTSTVTTTVAGLFALTQYEVYCAVMTVNGDVSTDADVLSTMRQLETQCCKTITFTNAPTFVYGAVSQYTATQTAQYVFSYALSSAPASALTITPIVLDIHGAAVSAITLAVTPASTPFASASASLVGRFVLSGSAVLSGSYVIVLVPSGVSGTQYQNVSTHVSVLSSATAKPTPVLSSAKFSNSGGALNIVFNSPTNKADITANSFVCSQLFSFGGAGSSTCSWVSSSAVTAVFASSANGVTSYADIDDYVVLLPGLIKAACATGVDCSFYEIASSQQVIISSPDAPVVPTVVLRTPAVIAACDDVTVDPSLTAGSGGRRWASVTWGVVKTVGAGTEDSSSLVSYMTSFGPTTSAPIRIPKSSLGKAIYTVSLTVENFLGQTAQASTIFSVDDNPNLPVISILGSPVRTMMPSDALTLFTSTSLASCAEPTAALSYRWKVFAGGVLQNIPSTSTVASRFRLSAYALSVHTVYTVQFEATANATANNAAITSTASVTVQVVNGAVFAVVFGGYNRNFATVAPITLDASSSYDQNVAPGSTSALTYDWSCRYLTTSRYGESCDTVLSHSVTNAARLTFNSTLLDPLSLYGMQVVVSSADGRFSSAVVSVKNSGGSTSASISTLTTKVNYNSKLSLSGVVRGNYALDCFWSAEVDGAAIVFRSSTPLTGSFARGDVVPGLAYPLSIPPNSLPAGSTVTFRLTAHYAGNSTLFSSFSEASVQINAPPSGGFIVSDPSAGDALSTLFEVTASSWSDDPSDFPLSYEYAYQTLSSQPALTVQSRTSSNTLSTTLPAGLDSQGHVITLKCIVYDSSLASSTSSTGVVVTTSVTTDISAYVASQIAASLTTGNADLVSQAIANAATSVNAVNCSLAGSAFCSALNREACFSTPQTCSSCLEGFSGISGDSNVRCRNLTAENVVLGTVGAACSVDDDCLLNNCVGQVCTAPSKKCPSTTQDICSGNGVCVFVDPAGQELSTACLVTDSTCVAQCSCFDAYGGASCALSGAELTARDSTRAQLCESILSVGSSADVSTQLLDSLVSSLYVSYEPSEVVSAHAQEVCQTALSFVADLAAQGFLTSDSTTSLMFQSLSKYVAPAVTASRRRLQDGLVESNGSYVNQAVSQMSQGILSNMANGEDPVTYTTDNLQVVISKSLVSGNLTLAPPQTDGANAYSSGTTSSSIELPSDAAAQLDNGDGYVEVALAQWGTNPFPNSTSLTSSLLRIETSAPDSNTTTTRVRDTTTSTTGAEAPMFYVVIQFYQAQAFNRSISIEDAIQGNVANFTFPECRMYDGAQYCACEGCNLSTYTDHNATFACPVSLLTSAGLSGDLTRRLQNTDDDAVAPVSSNIQIGTVFQHLISEFTGTLSRNPFNIDINQAKGVLSFLCVLIFVIIMGYISFHRWDCMDHAYLIYAKPEVDRKLFNKKYEESVERFLKKNKEEVLQEGFGESDSAQGSDDSEARKARKSLSKKSFFGSFRSSGSPRNRSSLNLQELGSTKSNGRLSPTGASSKYDLLGSPNTSVHSPKNRRKSGLTERQMQYEALFERTVDEDKAHRELFVSTIVTDFLDSVMPKESLLKPDATPIMSFVVTIMKYHTYTAMFFEPSLQYTRSMRWTVIVFGTLIAQFTSTLFFDIFYPDSGLCEAYTDKMSCVAPPSKVTSSDLCVWTEDASMQFGGECALTPPPQDFIFIVVLVLITMTVSLPLNGFFDFLLFFYCCRRPDLAKWGLNTEYWMGRATQDIHVGDEFKESPIQTLYRQGTEKEEVKSIRNGESSGDLLADSDFVEKEKARKLKRLHDDNDFIARHTYHDFSPAEAECDQMLTEVSSFLGVFANLCEIPWQSSKVSAMRKDRADAIQEYAGIYADGRPVPLGVIDTLRYGTPKQKLISTINTARAGAKEIEANLKILGDGEMQNRDTMLLQYFILEQFTLFKQFILCRHMFVFSLSSPLPIDPLIWLTSWIVIICGMIFFLYWAFAWGVSQGGKTFESWLVNLSFSILQDVFAVQIFKVYVIYVVSLVSIKPQLKYIYRVLNRVAVSYAQDELVDNLEEIRVVQYVSAACRAARLQITHPQATANILRNINDTDVEQCRLRNQVNMSTFVMIAIAIPVVLSIVGEAAGDETMRAIIPPAVSAVLVMNYKFYIAAGLLIMIPYLSFIFVILWLLRMRVRHQQLERERKEALANAVQHYGVKKWNSATRAELQDTSYSAMAWSALKMFMGHYFTRPLDIVQVLMSQIIAAPKVKGEVKQHWSLMNLPFDLQGTEIIRGDQTPASVVLTVNRSRSIKSITFSDKNINEMHSVKSSRVGTERSDLVGLEALPDEILSLRIRGSVNWLSVWRRNRYAEDVITKPVVAMEDERDYLPKGYLIGVLNKKLMQAHTPPEYVALGGSLNQLPARRTASDEEEDNGDEEEVDVQSDVISLDSRLSIDHELAPHAHATARYSSKATRTFRERHTIVYTAHEALQRIFLSYQLRVRNKTMQLVDEDERDALLHKAVSTCNVLISYSDLRASLLEVWELFEPGRVALGEEEIEEVVSSFDRWIVEHGEAFMHLHYHKHLAEIESITLARLEALRDQPEELLEIHPVEIAPNAVKVPRFSVPFQRFRRWFAQTCQAIEKYRRVVVQAERKKLQPKCIKL